MEYFTNAEDPQVIDPGRPMCYEFDIVQTRFVTISVKAASLAEARAFAESLSGGGRVGISDDDAVELGRKVEFYEMYDYDGRAEYEPEIEEMRRTLGKRTRDAVGREAVRHLAHNGACAHKYGLWNNYREISVEEAVETLKRGGRSWAWKPENGGCVGFYELSWGKGKDGERVLQIAQYNENDLL